jgi:hypothetical protein
VTVPQPAVGSQTFSIEGDILGYKALQSDAEAIACDAAGVLPGVKAAVIANKPNKTTQSGNKKVINYQLFRSLTERCRTATIRFPLGSSLDPRSALSLSSFLTSPN